VTKKNRNKQIRQV